MVRRRVVVGPIGERRTVLVKDHPENDDDQKYDDQCHDAFPIGNCVHQGVLATGMSRMAALFLMAYAVWRRIDRCGRCCTSDT